MLLPLELKQKIFRYLFGDNRDTAQKNNEPSEYLIRFSRSLGASSAASISIGKLTSRRGCTLISTLHAPLALAQLLASKRWFVEALPSFVKHTAIDTGYHLDNEFTRNLMEFTLVSYIVRLLLDKGLDVRRPAEEPELMGLEELQAKAHGPWAPRAKPLTFDKTTSFWFL